MVDQLDVRRVLCMPVQSDGRAVGTLNVYATQPRPSREELMALGAFAVLSAELVRTGVELISRNLEVAQLRQALASRVWIGKQGHAGAPKGVTSTSVRTAAEAGAVPPAQAGEVAQEVVQQVQKERRGKGPG